MSMILIHGGEQCGGRNQSPYGAILAVSGPVSSCSYSSFLVYLWSPATSVDIPGITAATCSPVEFSR